MKKYDDERFRARVGPPRARGEAGPGRFIGRISQATTASGRRLGIHPSGRRPGARLGRGHAAARFAGQSLGPRSRRVIVKSRVVVHRRVPVSSLGRGLDYIERDGVQPGGGPGELTTAESREVDREAFEQRIKGDRHHFKIIVSPEDALQISDLKGYTRELMAQMERDLGTRLEWVAIDHWDTDNPHVHILLRGKDDTGEDLVISSDYISHGMRHRAAELATRWLGSRTEREIRQTLTREVHQERWTSLDGTLQRSAREGALDLQRLTREVEDLEHRGLLIGRLKRLSNMGLAERLGPNTWRLSPDMASTLRALGERGDIIRATQRAFGDEQRELAIFNPATATAPVSGRIAAIGRDEFRDRGYLILDGIDGRAYHVSLSSKVRVSELRIGAVVTVTGAAEPRSSDRNIGELARDGIYRTDEHLRLARAQAKAGQEPEAFVQAHVRRLEALRRAGIVERIQEGIWRIPADLPQRGQAYDARRAEGALVEWRSALPIEHQKRALGATWLDRLLVRPPDSLAAKGFGAQVRTALAEREGFLVDQGFAQRRGARVWLARNLLATLRARELEATSRTIQAQTGLLYRELADGEPVTGIYRRSLTLASGRFAMLDDATGFALVPWRPVIERRLGQSMSAVVRGEWVSWSFGRVRGVGR